MNDVSPTRDSSTYSVHIGAWTNWSHGPILGAKLTLDRQSGGLLIAALALFIVWVGTSFWRICCFTFHQVYSSDTAKDGLYHQRQAILRNSGSAWRGLTNLLQAGWAWRRNPKLSVCHTLPMVICAALCACAFVFASIFSSMIATSFGDEVLISSPDCGYTNAQLDNPNTLASQTFEPYLRQNALSYAQYAQQCYHTNASTVVDCSQFVKKNLLGTSKTDATCAFGGRICQDDSSNLDLDTGLLDSNEDFGLNAPPEETFQYRRRIQCAPLKTEGYQKQVRMPSNRKYMRYYYGKRTSGPARDENYTYEYYNDALKVLLETNMTSDHPDYSLSGFYSFSVNSSISTSASNFEPIPPLNIPNADVSLFFLSGNQVIYTAPTNDSWYRGNRLVSEASAILPPNPGVQGPYFSSEAASPLACAVQEQYCSASLPTADQRCSPLASSADALANITAMLQDDEVALQRFKWLAAATTGRALDLPTAVGRLGVQLLTARDRLQGGVQGGLLPDDQWQKDVMHWHATTMAQLQGLFVETATGPPGDGVLLPWLVRPSSPVERAMCQNQKILSPAHTSFALFPLILILALGALIILTSWILPPLLIFIARRRLLSTTYHPHHHRPSTSSSSSSSTSSSSSPESPPPTDTTITPITTTTVIHATGAPPAPFFVDPTTYARYEWLATSTPQLVRLAHEGVHGVGVPWTRAGRSVPVTVRKATPVPTPAPTVPTTPTVASAAAAAAANSGVGASGSEKVATAGAGAATTTSTSSTSGGLAVFDLSDPKHPRLAPPPTPRPKMKAKPKEKVKPLPKKPPVLEVPLASGAMGGGGGGAGAGAEGAGSSSGAGAGAGSGDVEMRTRPLSLSSSSQQPKLLPQIRLREVSGSESSENTAVGEGDALGPGLGLGVNLGGSSSSGADVGGGGGGGGGDIVVAASSSSTTAAAAAAAAALAAAVAGTSTTGGGGEREKREKERQERAEERRREREREDELLREPLLPDYENWPLPPSGSLTPTLPGGGGEGEGGRKEGGSAGESSTAAGTGASVPRSGSSDALQVKKKRLSPAFL
ncbi:hypothetical protein DIS24_g6616 [Lasiodiplodia hormozganensis]|uniref:Uncharacterized protein n=1 Tax=Lasiodiplodia hormozganensis TaxID=869390 RepID=A0AA40CVH5_9PEZI|nr:hypothetical protein DIS24_g6616 [Lasiodiplodia hormozganensis]